MYIVVNIYCATLEYNIYMSQIHDLKRQFLEYIELDRGNALRTVENYDHYISRYFDFGQIKNIDDISPGSIKDFRLWLNRQSSGNNRQTGRTVSKKTQNYYLIAIRVFLKYLSKKGIKAMSADQIDLAKIPERQIDLITAGELTRLLSAPEGYDIKTLRDKAILELLFSTGLRVSELCSLSRDLDLTSDEFSIRGKGGKIRVVFLSDAAKNVLKKYLALRKDMEEALFVQVGKEVRKKSAGAVDGKTGALVRRSIERIVKHYAIKAGISKKVTPHVIRHCFATDLLSNGADIRSVQIMLGHSNIATTQIYTHITDKQLRDVHKKFHSKR